MYIKVKYFKPFDEAYGGREYTYKTDLPLNEGDKVIAPTVNGDMKAIVTAVNVPEGQIDERWADKIRAIDTYDKEDETA